MANESVVSERGDFQVKPGETRWVALVEANLIIEIRSDKTQNQIEN